MYICENVLIQYKNRCTTLYYSNPIKRSLVTKLRTGCWKNQFVRSVGKMLGTVKAFVYQPLTQTKKHLVDILEIIQRTVKAFVHLPASKTKKQLVEIIPRKVTAFVHQPTTRTHKHIVDTLDIIP